MLGAGEVQRRNQCAPAMAPVKRESRSAEALAVWLGAIPAAGTLVEAYIAAEYRGVGPAMVGFIRFLGPEVVPATAETAVQALRAFRTWGKGRHPAKLNFGDCFAYALAEQLDCPLLFIGNDFSQTDIASVL